MQGVRGNRFIDLSGQHFGKLAVIRVVDGVLHGRVWWWVRCDCGVEKVVSSAALRRGRKSCGCILRTHNLSSSRTYKSWQMMWQRCTNPKFGSYGYCGAKGVRVCERWGWFKNFNADMGARPEGTSIDRIDPYGDYEPTNCRWATRAQQDANKRSKARAKQKQERSHAA